MASQMGGWVGGWVGGASVFTSNRPVVSFWGIFEGTSM